MFKIENVYRNSPDLLTVKVAVEAKDWAMHEAMGEGVLKHFYEVVISNRVSSKIGLKAGLPMINDNFDVDGGVKLVELSYFDSEFEWNNNLIKVDFTKRTRVA